MTIAEVRTELAKGIAPKTEEAARTALEKYFKDKWTTEVRLRNIGMGWDHKIQGFGLNQKGQVYVTIYWQGDSTDGTESVLLKNVVGQTEYVIPARYESGYCTHGRITVRRDEIADALKEFAREISPAAIKERNERKKMDEFLRETDMKVSDRWYDSYRYEPEKWWNAKTAVRKYFEKNWKELMKMDGTERDGIMSRIFKANCRNNYFFKRDSKGEKIYVEE